MTELRRVALVVGSQDVAGVAAACIETAHRFVAGDAASAMVCGPEGVPLQQARELELPTIEFPLPGLPRHRSHAAFHELLTADLVHAAGLQAAALIRSAGLETTAPIAVSVDSIGSRHLFLRRQHSPYRDFPAHEEVWWLVHGRTATAQVVQSNAVRGDHVLTLPLLPFTAHVGERWAAARAAARDRLALQPGAHAVAGFGPRDSAGFRALQTMLRRAQARALTLVWVDTGRNYGHVGDGRNDVMVVGMRDGRDLLPGMDVLVADGTFLAARHPAVDAARAAIPIVASPTDVASDVIRHSINGYVCAPSEFGTAVAAAIEMGASRGLQRRLRDRRRAAGFGDLAAAMARSYSFILGRPLVRPVLMGRRAAR